MNLPNIDPIILHIWGPLAISWYSMSYVGGIIAGWVYGNLLISKFPSSCTHQMFSDLIVWIIIAIIFGGRIGYVIFYNLEYFINNPAEILQTYNGGMSFHGALIFVGFACFLFTKYRFKIYKERISFLNITDLVCSVAPIGIMFGRIANFINGELWGRLASEHVRWAFIFPRSGNLLPRHPSQLYEAAIEGLLLWIIIAWLIFFRKMLSSKGFITSFFLIFYSVSRFILENFRAPDEHLGLFAGLLSMGQILSIIFLLIGVVFAINYKNQ